MRKLQRSILRHQAYINRGGHKYFKYLWKQLRTRQGKTMISGQPVNTKSMLRRTIEKALRKIGIGRG